MGAVDQKHIPVVYINQKKSKLPTCTGPEGMTPETLEGIAELIEARKLAIDNKHPKFKKQASTFGYRFPLNSLVSTGDRLEINMLKNKFINEGGGRCPQVWVYYYPSTATAESKIHDEFFSYVFPSKEDKAKIAKVAKDPLTQMFAIAVHDKIYVKPNVMKTTSNVICAISFCILNDVNREPQGSYIYYLGTLPGARFDDVAPTNGKFKNMRCPIEGNGLAHWLLRLTQVFVYNIKKQQTYNMFIAANTLPTTNLYNESTTISQYYKNIMFEELSDWSSMPDQVQECARREISDLSQMVPMVIKEPLRLPKHHTQRFIKKHCLRLQRCLNDLKNESDMLYMRKMERTMNKYTATPMKPDKQNDENAQKHFLSTFDKFKYYDPAGKEWKDYHHNWSGKAQVQFWDIRKDFETADDDKDRTQGTLMPLEALFFDYISIGRVIKNNVSERNDRFNIICQMCDCKMTAKPLTLNEINGNCLSIIEKHYLGNDNHVLCLATPEDKQVFKNIKMLKK